MTANVPQSIANFYQVNFSPIRPQIIGILGGGQLGLMLAQAVLPLGIRCVFLEDSPNCPARLLGKVYSSEQLAEFLAAADIFTLEFENTPLKQAQFLAAHKPFYPPPQALQVAQDRLQEKQLFNTLGIKTVPFMAVANRDQLTQAIAQLGLPLVLKTSRGGYDGKGQYVLKTTDDADNAWQTLGAAAQNYPLIAEGLIDFERELSMLAVRSQQGDIRYYPLIENTHHQGILAKSQAPASHVEHLIQEARENISKILTHLDYVGVLTLELFASKDGLLANEIAPRVHNSGHWSIEGAICSQFANHMRAVAGLSLGDTNARQQSLLLNIIGNYPNLSKLLAIDGACVHLYDKEERPGRKLGHITLIADDAESLAQKAKQTVALLPNAMGLDAKY